MNATTVTLICGALVGTHGLTSATLQAPGNEASSRIGRSDAADASPVSRFRSREEGNRRPTPTVVFETTDVTSAIGKQPIVVSVHSFGSPVGEDLLKALAAEIRLYTEDSSREIGVQATIRDALPTASAAGQYRRTDNAKVEIQPLAPLSEGWYVLKLRSIPNGLTMPRFGIRQTLPDGSVGARISPTSRPRPAAFNVCPKAVGLTVVTIEWSEEIVRPSNLASLVTVREVSAPSSAGDCVPDPGQDEASARSLRFLCQNVPAVGARFVVKLDSAIKGIGGGNLDVPANAASGKTEVEIALDSMQKAGEGCKMYKAW